MVKPVLSGEPCMSEPDIAAELASRIAGAIRDGFEQYHARFAAITARARRVSPLASTTPTARPCSLSTRCTPACTRSSAPAARAEAAMAWLIAPMPPIAWPQAPFTPLHWPNTWCSST
ncbi:hypothetical protein G6F54_014012 [Rhizopus delemar]|nr:hypothetical protein G6F54_014012 [Rhizopus delemar]